MKTQLVLAFAFGLLPFPSASFSQSMPGTVGAGTPPNRTGMSMRCPSPMKAETGAPYSITFESEESRPGLPEGRRVLTRLTKLYRDSQGRTRMERFMPVPPGAPQDLRWLSIRILDPVAGVGYMFNLRDNVAIRAVCAPVPPRPAPTSDERAAAEARAEARSRMTSETERLGTQMIEGFLAEGKRTTTAYPAGSVNNDQPFVSVREVWHSPELKMEVLSKTTDPLRGDISERLTQFDRAEPDPSLFLPPPGYTILDQ